MNKIFLMFLLSVAIVSCNHEVTPGQIAAGPKPSDPNAIITGTVTLAEGVKPLGLGTLFIIARPQGQDVGPPLAVKRVEDPVFPVSFEMSQNNVMLQGSRFSGAVTLKAKWSKEGSPMSLVPGDLSMTTPAQIDVGARDIKLVLDHREE